MSPSRPKRKGHFARRFIKEAFYQTFYNVGFRKVRIADVRLKVEVADDAVLRECDWRAYFFAGTCSFSCFSSCSNIRF
jgi:hypothetical protein